jgi:TolA-binding protein
MRRNGRTDSSSQLEPKQEMSDDERKQLLEAAIEKNEKVAESGIEMAKLFLHNGKRQIANRRLREIVEDFGGTAAAKEAKSLLKKAVNSGR